MYSLPVFLVILLSLCLSYVLQAIRLIIINSPISEYRGPIQGTSVPLRLIMLFLNQKTELATGQLGLFRSEGREPGHGSSLHLLT